MLGKKKGQIIYKDPLDDGDTPETLPIGEKLKASGGCAARLPQWARSHSCRGQPQKFL